MAQTKNNIRQRKPSRTKRSSKKKVDLSNNMIGFILLFIAVFSFFQWGALGVLFANVFRFIGGDTHNLLALVIGAYGLYLVLKGHNPLIKLRYVWGSLIGYVGVLLSLSAYTLSGLNIHNNFLNTTLTLLSADFARLAVTEHIGGGMLGALIYTFSYPLLGQIGTYVISSLVVFAGALVLFDVPFSKVAHVLYLGISWLGEHTMNLVQAVGQHIDLSKVKIKVPVSKTKGTPKAPRPTKTDKAKASAAQPKAAVDLAPDNFEIHSAKSMAEPAKPAETTPKTTAPHFSNTVTPSNYQLPAPTLLTQVPAADQSQEYAVIKQNREKLRATLDSFGVDVTVKSASLGPSITKYEVQPAIGVKVSKIVNLADDLAMALAAKDIRIEAPIPGKPYVGIEVPNKQVAPVSFRNVIEHTPNHPDKILEVPLGQDVTGQIITMDLTKMPHLLIAGSTGSGKSVAINTIITSILMRARPEQVRLMLVDPKMVELNVYNGIPHLLIPVVTDAKKAAGALNKVVKEMERRYQLFADNSVRNMSEYNQMVTQTRAEAPDNNTLELLPYIVVIVDELSDLMMVAGNEVESAIVRLAQMARAAGIHMIIATQRPSVDVITGLIKANIPSRIAFAVSSGIDSRTILDTIGAEKLLGRGDMLFSPIGTNKPVRIQGAFISVKDVEAVVAYVSQQQAVQYDESMVPSDTDDQADMAEPEDEFYQQAVDLVTQQQKASVSMLQRRFRIGYNHAARLVDEMEARGIVGPADGSRPRKVLKPKSEAD
nr:DNA translocase FtsK [Agrilactobacillus composti]